MPVDNVRLDHTKGGQIARGAQTWQLDQFALLDKIINVKFTRANGDTFTIRSDYEVVIDSTGTPSFKVMQPKPAITLSYQQVAHKAAIELDLRISNLFFNTRKAGSDVFSRSDRRIIKMDIQMGYRRQFPDFTDRVLSTDTAATRDPKAEKNRLNLYYELAQFQIRNTFDDMTTGLLLSASVLAVYNEGMPPNRVTVFQGIVGTLNYGFSWNGTSDVQGYYGNSSNFPTSDEQTPDWTGTQLEQILFTHMTSRFFNPKITCKLLDTSKEATAFGAHGMQAFVWDYDAESNSFITAEGQAGKSNDDRWGVVPFNNQGIMNKADALMLGVRVHCSDAVKAAASTDVLANSDSSNGAAGMNHAKHGVPFQLFEEAQLLEIRLSYPFIRWWRNPKTGDFFVYHKDEAIQEVSVSIDRAAIARGEQPLILPAVYDVAVSGVRTIRCPFVSFLAPGQQIVFSAKYSISDMVGFFYPHEQDMAFRVIWAEILFSTVGTDNMMTLMCVDLGAPKPDTPLGNEPAPPTGQQPSGQQPSGQQPSGQQPSRQQPSRQQPKPKKYEIVWRLENIGDWMLRETKVVVNAHMTWLDFAIALVMKNSLGILSGAFVGGSVRDNVNLAKAFKWWLSTGDGNMERTAGRVFAVYDTADQFMTELGKLIEKDTSGVRYNEVYALPITTPGIQYMLPILKEIP